MSIWEISANVISIILFAILFYRLLQVTISLPYRLGMLRDVERIVESYRREVLRQLQLVGEEKGSLLDALESLKDFIASRIDPFQTMAMMERVISHRVNKNEHRADYCFGDWIDRISLDFTRHYGLANMATEIGMLGTVAGGIFAFDHIGESDDPFAAFPSLALAMLTTAAGLVIAILVKLVLAHYDRRISRLSAMVARTIDELAEMLQTAKELDDAPVVVGGNERPVAQWPWNSAEAITVELMGSGLSAFSKDQGVASDASPLPILERIPQATEPMRRRRNV